jgi:hypothetical protein
MIACDGWHDHVGLPQSRANRIELLDFCPVGLKPFILVWVGLMVALGQS